MWFASTLIRFAAVGCAVAAMMVEDAAAQAGAPSRDVGEAPLAAFERLRTARTTAAGKDGRALSLSGDRVALPVDLPVLGYQEQDVAAARERLGALGFSAPPRFRDVAYGWDDTGAWYSQSFTTEFGEVLVEGQRTELDPTAPIYGGRLARALGAPPSFDAPAISRGGDDFSSAPSEVTASFEIGGVNYRVTLSCDTEAPTANACAEDAPILSLVSTLTMLDQGQRR